MGRLSFENFFFGLPFILVVIIIALLCFITALVVKSYKKKDNNCHLDFGDSEYQGQILNALAANERLDFSNLFIRLNELKNLSRTLSSHLYTQQNDAYDSFDKKIREVQSQIVNKWEVLNNKRNFYNCIGLHYASFTTADIYKRTQETIRDAFVRMKKECENLQNKIQSLNTRITSAHGQIRYEMMLEHKQTCETHKRATQMKNLFAQRNAQYLEMVKKQNAVTKKYREYIINNCGRKGRDWGRRLAKRKMDQVLH